MSAVLTIFDFMIMPALKWDGGGHRLQMPATELYSAADELLFFLMGQHAPILRDWIVPNATITYI